MRHIIGIPDEEFMRGKVPMTKQEIRILTLSKARIEESDVVLDIGAGTGSLSIEAALAAPLGMVYAVERNPEGVALIKTNANKFRVSNLKIFEGVAPDVLDGLPKVNVDVVLIGGSGKHLPEIVDRCEVLLKIGGRLVINCITAETLAESLAKLKARAVFRYEAMQVQITNLAPVGDYHMFKGLNPIYIITATKGETK